MCNSTTKPVFVVLFLNILHGAPALPFPQGGRGPTTDMRKRNFLKTDRSARNARVRKALIGAGILLGIYLLASFVLGEMGLIKYYRMEAQYNALTEEIATLKQDNARLARDVRALKTDPDHIEQIARDKLGLARPGEIVYYYGNP